MPRFIEGYVPGGTDVALGDGGTGASLSDPNADRILFWDDSAGQVTWLTPGTGLTITGTSITSSGGGSGTQYESRSSNTILGTADAGKLIDITAAISQTFTAAATLGAGWLVTLRNAGAIGTLVTLDPNGTETIGGATTYPLLPGEAVLVLCDGSNFILVRQEPPVRWNYVYKTADEDVSSNTTLQDDDELQFTMPANAVFEIEMVVVYSSPSGGSTPDIKYAMGEDNTTRGVYTTVAQASTSDVAGAPSQLSALNVAGQAGTGGGGAQRLLLIHGFHTWGGGATWKFQWAQNTSNGNATRVHKGSFLRWRAIS